MAQSCFRYTFSRIDKKQGRHTPASVAIKPVDSVQIDAKVPPAIPRPPIPRQRTRPDERRPDPKTAPIGQPHIHIPVQTRPQRPRINRIQTRPAHSRSKTSPAHRRCQRNLRHKSRRRRSRSLLPHLPHLPRRRKGRHSRHRPLPRLEKRLQNRREIS